MKRLWVILTVVLFAAGVAGAEMTASLKVAANPCIPWDDLHQAELTVENPTGSAVETVLLKPAGVGLTVRYRLTIPPGSDGKQTVLLPAISPVQEYAVTALDTSGGVVGRAYASITWPAELVNTEAFIDDAFRAWTDDPARWPAKTRRRYLLVLAMFVTAAVATLLIRRPMWRTGATVVLAAAVTALLVFVFIPTGPETVQVHCYELFLYDNVGGFQSDSFAVLSSRRTTKEQSDKAWPLPHPVYPDRAAAVNDDTVVNPVTNTIRLTLRPGQVRIIRPARVFRRRGQTGPRIQPRYGSTRREANGFAVEANLIYGNALLIHNDSVWRVGSATVAQKASVRTDRAESYGAFINGEGGRKLNHHARRLLNYWRNKHQRSNEFYLVEPSSGEAGDNMTVVQLDEVSAW